MPRNSDCESVCVCVGGGGLYLAGGGGGGGGLGGLGGSQCLCVGGWLWLMRRGSSLCVCHL